MKRLNNTRNTRETAHAVVSSAAWRRRPLIALGLVWLFFAASTVSADSDEALRVAVASNFGSTAAVIADAYTAKTGVDVDLIVSSTGKLYAQISRGAPFDVFLSADERRPEMLFETNRMEAPQAYAEGILTLWAPRAGNSRACTEREILRDSRRIAIANPDVAPYGEAARQILDEPALAELSSGKLTQSESVGQAFSLVAVGAVEAGLVSYAQVLQYEGNSEHCLLKISPDRHLALRQFGGVLVGSKQSNRARDFMKFLTSTPGAALIVGAGYRKRPDE